MTRHLGRIAAVLTFTGLALAIGSSSAFAGVTHHHPCPPTASPSPSSTPTATPTSTPTSTPSPSPSSTPTSTPTSTGTPTRHGPPWHPKPTPAHSTHHSAAPKPPATIKTKPTAQLAYTGVPVLLYVVVAGIFGLAGVALVLIGSHPGKHVTRRFTGRI